MQVFGTMAGGWEIFYLQVCGQPQPEQLVLLKEEMQKALERLLSRKKKSSPKTYTYLVYEESFAKWLESVQGVEKWQQWWNMPVYSDYHSMDNLKWMLQRIPVKQYPKEARILGYGYGMQEWLPWIAPYVKRIVFYVEFITKGFEDLKEELEEEYGLVPQVHLVVPGEFRKQRMRSEEPVLVVDFSGKETISVAGLARDSVWVDMDSIEAKRHSIEDRKTGITYISLKNLWKAEMSETLDTISNFEYNTEVKIGRIGW